MHPFRSSHPKEAGQFQASKWLSYRVLLDETEMEDLFATLSDFSLYNVSEIIDPENGTISKELFLEEYTTYIQALKAGRIMEPKKHLFSAALSATPDAFYAMEIPNKGILLKICKPVIQLSLHSFVYSPLNQSFYFMVHSEESVTWGVQFAYPQLYSNSIQGDVIEVLKDRTSPNTMLFQTLKGWMRRHSRSIPFLIEGKRVNVEPRLGNRCFDWIDQHPQLKEKEIQIYKKCV